jgi:hypothetical protein
MNKMRMDVLTISASISPGLCIYWLLASRCIILPITARPVIVLYVNAATISNAIARRDIKRTMHSIYNNYW